MNEESEGCNETLDNNSSDIGDEASKKIIEEIEDTHVSPSSDDNAIDEETSELGKITSKPMPIKSIPPKLENLNETARSIDQSFENGKRKVKEEKPPTKVIVRRLPPLMSKEIFLEQVSPLPCYDYMYFVSGDPSYGINSFSRAYLNFTNQEDVFTFTRTFDNYVFLDAKGQEFPAIVEFAPFQRVPKLRSKKKDSLTGTIESDPVYISFRENFLAEALENSKPGAKTMKQHYFETEISTTEEINTTPLLEFLKIKRAEKARMRDERREEKKRKDAERKLKQKAKDKKLDGEEEETKDVKIHHCNVSAEKSYKKGEFALLLKSEKEKVPVKIVENCSTLINRICAKESLVCKDKITIKKRKDKIIDVHGAFTPKIIDNNSFSNDKNLPASCGNTNKELNVESPKRQNSVPCVCEKNNILGELLSNPSSSKNNSSTCEMKKAEQQTKYLRKILGLGAHQENSTSEKDTLNKGGSTRQDNSISKEKASSNEEARHAAKVFISSQKTFWCERNINPALPCASFNNSSKYHSFHNETDSKKINVSRKEIEMNKKEDASSVELCQVNKPFKGEIVIDRALSTNNVLPSAFKKPT